MIYRIAGIRLTPEDRDGALQKVAAELLGIDESRIVNLSVFRRSIDARRNHPPAIVYIADVEITGDVPPVSAYPGGIQVKPVPGNGREAPDFFFVRREQRPVVVGCGPAGLFAALTFVRHGIPALLLERGKSVRERAADVDAFWRWGRLDPESNVQFGEGGAGTFSDGKLTSRVKNPFAGWVKEIFVEMGAPRSILTDGKPHIGTDRLRRVLVNFRKYLMDKGCEIRFGAKMTDLLIHNRRIAGLVVNGIQEIGTDCLILAIGQSADDTYGLLQARKVHLEPKPFAMGLRIEHPKQLIDTVQYGRWARHPLLPPAEYFLSANVKEMKRSVYTFCMCPGGRVIGSGARAGTVVTNGMSASRRDGLYANSAVVVNVRVEDFLDKAASPLSGLAFRCRWEETAFVLGGKDYRAPAELVTNFLQDKASPRLGTTTFLPGVRAVPLKEALPPFAVSALKEGLKNFERRLPHFTSGEAHLIGIETRTSSPVRITRGPDGQNPGLAGLYPCGEGAGYAGGIISSALDGIRAAQRAITA